jgi:UrcA family protein
MVDPDHQGRIMHTGIISKPASGRARLATLLAAIAATGLNFAPAATASEAPTIRVPIGDLNLASAQGQRVLERRVSAAVRSVCTPKTAAVSATINVARVQVAQCRRDTLADVQRQLDQHGLPKLYMARGN